MLAYYNSPSTGAASNFMDYHARLLAKYPSNGGSTKTAGDGAKLTGDHFGQAIDDQT